jgi:ATP-dependent DNA helicase RecG
VIGTLESPLTVLIGGKRALEARLARLDVRTVGDLLYLFPKRYDDYSAIRPIAELAYGEHQTIIATVRSAGVRTLGGRREVSEAIVGDQTGSIKVIWWSGRWIAGRLKPGMRLALSGKIDAFGDRLQMGNPEWEPLGAEAVNTRRIVPVYPLTDGLAQRDIRPLIRQAVDAFAHKVEEALPEALRREKGLPPVVEALREVHAPSSLAGAEAATRRFAFEELLNIELGVIRRRREWQAAGGAPRLVMSDQMRDRFIQSLPFDLTADQRKAINGLLADLSRDVPMTRLLEGDVGSGKTVVAAAALLAAVASGYQGAVMAPTEILAEQHYRTLCRLLSPASEGHDVEGVWFRETAPGYVALRTPYMQQPVRVSLLRGGLKAAEKAAVQEAIAKGEVDIAVGTHALVQQDVEFQRLGLAIVDEQHRFGVAQRAALREKGQSPHVLVMTATPIPRTLALTVYGDLDITVIREMPPGRPEVKTHRVGQRRRQEAYDFLRKKIGEGRQAYVICPLVEESEAIEAKAAVQEHERLSREEFPDLRLGLLHGRMTPGEKDATMRSFRDGELDVLVSTAVVEVGIDVPNATVMLIEAADRFGLTQLHQFRGRVRRSTEQAYCLLLSETASPEADERLQIMVDVSDGFRLAEEDLRLRGAGDYFGTRQSGMPNLRVAKLTDVDLIEQARAEATSLLDDDPELIRPEHVVLRTQVEKLWDRVTAEAS